MLPLPREIGCGEHGKLQHGQLKPAFNSLPVVAPETLQISKLDLFMTIPNNFQPLTVVVKSSTVFLNFHMALKGDYWHC